MSFEAPLVSDISCQPDMSWGGEVDGFRTHSYLRTSQGIQLDPNRSEMKIDQGVRTNTPPLDTSTYKTYPEITMSFEGPLVSDISFLPDMSWVVK
jgi:hypothetical protein